MKSAKLLNFLVASMLLATFATGCKKNPKNITNIPRRDVNINSGVDPSTLQGGRITPGGATGQDLTTNTGIAEPVTDGTQDETTLAAQTVYFEFDKTGIRASEQPKLDAVATYVKSNANVKQIIVQGHCDERGTEEYNRSLGERRANAAREYLLQKHGISSEKVTTVSFGEDRPASLERTEEGYAKNRRAQFVVVR